MVSSCFIKNRLNFNSLWNFLLGPFPSPPPAVLGPCHPVFTSLEYLSSYNCFNFVFHHCLWEPYSSLCSQCLTHSRSTVNLSLEEGMNGLILPISIEQAIICDLKTKTTLLISYCPPFLRLLFIQTLPKGCLSLYLPVFLFPSLLISPFRLSPLPVSNSPVIFSNQFSSV